MKTIFFLLWFFLFNILYSQEVDTIHIHYFKTGNVSTISTIKQGWGKAKAFDSGGKKIYEMQIRKVAGSASVRFTHHANGMVKTAKYYSAPDAGIQWYRKTTEFNDQGKVIKEIEDSHDRMQKVLFDQSKQEVVSCNPIHNNDLYMINTTKHDVMAIIDDKKSKDTIYISANDTLKALQYISSEITQPPSHFYDFHFETVKKRKWMFFRKEINIFYSTEKVVLNKTKTEYYISIEE